MVKEKKKSPFSFENPLKPGKPATGLVPIGDTGLYRTPDEPASPLDCNRYPNSPYCGGNPFNRKPFDINIGFVKDDCNIGITLTPALGFIKLPTSTIVYRYPLCRKKPEKPLPPDEPSPPPPLPPTVPNTTKIGCLYQIMIETEYWVYLSDGYNTGEWFRNRYIYPIYCWGRFEGIEIDNQGTYGGYDGLEVGMYIKAQAQASHVNLRTRKPDGTYYSYPTFDGNYINFPIYYTDAVETFIDYWYQFPVQEFYNNVLGKPYRFGISYYYDGNPQYNQFRNYITAIAMPYGERNNENTIKNRIVGITEIYCLSIPPKILNPPPPPPLIPPECCMGCCPNVNTNDALLKLLLIKVNRLSKVINTEQYNQSAIPTLTDKVDAVGQLVIQYGQNSGEDGEPPDNSELLYKVNRIAQVVGIDDYSNPPVKTLSRIIEEMYNVIGVGDFVLPDDPTIAEKIQRILDVIGISNYSYPPIPSLTDKVEKIAEILGVDEFPASLPDSLISKDEGFLGNLIPNDPVEIPNFAKLMEWYIKRFDEIVGQFEIAVEIKDSDPTKPGEQPVGIKLPNIAEAIGEIFTLNFQTYMNSETMLNATMRILAEVGQDKQQNFVSYKLLQSLTDWAGFKQNDIKLPMPLLFTLNKTRYDEILKESTVDVVCQEFSDKFGLEADFIQFREAVAMLKANYKVKLNPNGNIKEQILKHLLDMYANTKKINKEDDEDFDKFLEQVEEGFINTSGAENTTKPYGRDYSERPKIKDLTKNTDPPTQQ